MSTISKKACDRCGNPLKYVGLTAIFKNVFKKGKTIAIREYFNGNQDGYSYMDGNYELCADCTEKLREFLRNDN